MKNKILNSIIIVSAMAVLAGCTQHSDDAAPAATNSAAGQSTANVAVTNNDAAPPNATWIATNNPVLTNSNSTDNSSSTNQ